MVRACTQLPKNGAVGIFLECQGSSESTGFIHEPGLRINELDYFWPLGNWGLDEVLVQVLTAASMDNG